MEECFPHGYLLSAATQRAEAAYHLGGDRAEVQKFMNALFSIHCEKLNMGAASQLDQSYGAECKLAQS